MGFQIEIAIESFIVSVIASLIIIPILRKLKIGQIERTDGPQSHLKKQGTPTMGGVIMAVTIAIITTVFLAGFYRLFSKEPGTAKKLIPLVLLAIGFGLIGFIDDAKKMIFKDTKGLKPSYKMIGLLIISVAYTLYLTQILNLYEKADLKKLKKLILKLIVLVVGFGIVATFLGTAEYSSVRILPYW